MSGEAKCSACVTERYINVEDTDRGVWSRACTGRPGCLRAAGMEGGADIVDALRDYAATSSYLAESRPRGLIRTAADEITRLRAEVERLTAERDEALADRHARDIAVVKAALEAAATTATRLPYPGLDQWHGHTVDNFAIMVGKAIRAIDPEAVLKAMEGGR